MIKIIDFIPYGEENRVSKTKLMKITGLSSQELMEKIQEARKENIILSDTIKGGYWRPKTIKELMPIFQQTVKKLKENGELYNLIIKERDLIKERGK